MNNLQQQKHKNHNAKKQQLKNSKNNTRNKEQRTNAKSNKQTIKKFEIKNTKHSKET